MNLHRRQVADAIAAVRFLSPSRFAWRGTAVRALPQRAAQALEPEALRSHLRGQLKRTLYERYYIPGCVESKRTAEAVIETGDPAFVSTLSEANRGSGGWQPGWRIRQVHADRLALERDGLTVWATPAECHVPGRTRPGASAALRFGEALPHALPGFYLALGDAPLDGCERLIRMYWNVTSTGAPALVAALTTLLGRETVPFQLKVVDHPDRYSRCDTAVLYFPASVRQQVLQAAARAYPEVAPLMRRAVPALTRCLADGLAVAEDPGGGESFGTHRCALLADGLLRAHDSGAGRASERLEAVAARFADAGIAIDRPYQRVLDLDDLALAACRPTARSARRRGQAGAVDYLGVARALGARLCREALWHEDACSWMGPRGDGATANAVHASLEPDVYGGTSGVAWFLAELARLTGDAETARAATGAVRHALWWATRADAVPASGLFTGVVGIAVAAERVATVLGRDDLREQARAIIGARMDSLDAGAPSDFDLVSGRAGTIVGLLLLHRSWGDPPLLRLAAEMGERLMASAGTRDGADSWANPDIPAHQDLTGLSHGASGPALALAELAEASGRRTFRRGVERALAYERRCFDAAQGNWPDYRIDRRDGAGARTFETLWCHGATGIGLARLRIATLFADPDCHDEADRAMATVRAAVAQALACPGSGWGLCHGIAGNADALLTWSTSIGCKTSAASAHAAGRAGAGKINEWLATDHPIGLMTGIAGTGLFYLRIADPTIPSVLLLCPGDLGAHPRAPVVPAARAELHQRRLAHRRDPVAPSAQASPVRRLQREGESQNLVDD